MKRSHIRNSLLSATAALAITGCSLGNSAVAAGTTTSAALTTAAAAPAKGDSLGTLAGYEQTLEGIYAQISPSVVHIEVEQKGVASAGLPFSFFGQQGQQQQPFVQRGSGSGFVWDQNGDIVTNNHVVDGADQITVTYNDGTTMPATVVGTDPTSDLAVIKVDKPQAATPLTLADSTQVKVGQVAIAIGNPFGLDGTMTTGIVSALNRSLPAGEDQNGEPTYTIPNIIQTDASINPGNSGGVLVDDQGQLIGVTAAIESPSRASAGIGFAIPSAIVQQVVPALIKDGHYKHPWIGLSGSNLVPDVATAMGLDAGQRGALVGDITPGSPADKAGLHGSDRTTTIDGEQARVGGDIVTAIDGNLVKSFDELVAYLASKTQVGQTVYLTVLRDGKEQTLNLTLGERPDPTASAQANSTAGAVWLGIAGTTLTPDINSAMQLSADQTGVLIENIAQGSPADKAGLHGSAKALAVNGQRVLVGGDIITALDNQPITSVEDLQAAISQQQADQQVNLTVLRDGKQTNVSVTLVAQS